MIDTTVLRHLHDTLKTAAEADEDVTLPAADVRALSALLADVMQQVEAKAPDSPAAKVPGVRLGDLLESGLVGLWADRDDIGDSVEFARELRRKASRRRSLRDYYGE